MTAEQEYFIKLLRDYIHQDLSHEPERMIDWNTIARLANEQDLSGIIYYQTRKVSEISASVARKLKEGFFSDVYLSVNTDFAYDQLIRSFEQKHIEYMPFKGMLLRKYYPNSELRTMGDRDILIHHKDRQTADKIIQSLGYQKYVDNHAVWTYFKKNIMFEIHDVMFYENLANSVDYREYFSHIWDYTQKCYDGSSLAFIPDFNIHFIYSIAHTAKHVINKGMGFRAFLDMVFFVINADAVGDKPDWEWIKKELDNLQLLDFTKTCFSLCKEWFGIDMPFYKDEIDPVFVRKTTEKIFRDGVFGLKNQDNAASGSAKDFRRSEHGYFLTALGISMKKLFPPYRDMQLIPWYQWIDGKPFLLPVAWIYRWGYCLTHKRKGSKDILLEPYMKKENIKARENYLKRWGL